MTLPDTQYWLGVLTGLVIWFVLVDMFWKRGVEKRLAKLEANRALGQET